MVPPMSPSAARVSTHCLRPFGHQADHGMFGLADLGGARAFKPRQIPRRLDHRHVQAIADAEERHLAVCARTSTRRSCLRCRARRIRRAPGCHRHSPGSGGISALEALRCRSSPDATLTLLARPPWVSASDSDLVAVLDLHVLADHGDAHFAFGILHPLHHLSPADRSGGGASMPKHSQQLVVQPARDRPAAPVDGVEIHAPGSPAPATLQNSPILRRSSSGGDAMRGTAECRAGCRWRAIL